MTAASGGITAPPFTNFQQHQQLSEDEERISLEKLVRLRDAVRSGQHPNFRPKGSTAAPAATAFNQDRASNNKNANLNGAAGPSQKNDTSARPIPVFTGSMPVPAPAVKPEQNAGRAVITVSGKDTPHQNNQNGVRDPRDDRRQQNHHHHHHQQQQQPPPQQWDPNHQHQPWMIPPGQNQMHGNPNPNPEDINAFAQHLSMLPVPPPPFELPPGFPPLLTVPPLPLPGQPITAGQPLSHLMQMTNQNPTQPDPMVVDKPVLDTKKLEQRDRELLGIQQTAAQIPTTAAVGTDLQASLKKAQEYAATLPPKPAGGQKQNPPIASNKQQQQEKGRIGGAEESPTLAAFPDRRDDDRQNYQRQPPPRDHRQYADKRGAEPLRKTAINNNSVKEDRRERERDRSAFERERERERWAGGVDSRGYNFKKRKSSSPNYDDIPSKTPNFAAPQPIRPVDALIRSHDRRDVVDIDEQDDLKKRANPAPAKDTPKISQNVEKKASPAPPIKREAPPPSPVVTIPRGSPTLEPLSPGRARAYGVPPPQERYQMLPGAKQAGYFRYREPYPPPHLMGYARSPYEQEYGYPPPHARDPRPLSPRRMYPGPEPRGYAQEYIYQDPYQDPYYPYHPRRPGSPPPRGPPGPRYRYEDEDRVPRGRSPSPRAPSRMPMTRPRRSSRSVSPGRERPLPRPSAPPAEPAEESRPERGALIRASDAPHYADYPPSYHHQRSMVPYDAYGDPYRPVIVRERVPVYVTRVVYVDSNDPEGRPYRPRSPGYPPPHAPPPGPPAHAYQQPPQQHPPSSAAGASHPPPPPMRRYVDDPDIVMSDRMYRERDYDYGPYERGYPREYAREYPPPPPHHHHPHHPHHPPPPSAMRDPYGREYAMAPPRDEERERAFREREREYPGPPGPAGGHPPPMPMPSNAARDVEDGRMPYARDGRGMPPQFVGTSTRALAEPPATLPHVARELSDGSAPTSNNEQPSLPSPSLSPVTAALNLGKSRTDYFSRSDGPEEDPGSPLALSNPEEYMEDVDYPQFDDTQPLHGNSSLDRVPSLMQLPQMVDTFDLMPQAIKSYLMYQFLRRCDKNTLQFVAGVVNPALKCDFLARLPTELSLNIIKFLDYRSLASAAQVSKKWRILIDSDEWTWRRLFEADGYILADGELERAVREGWGYQDPEGFLDCEKDIQINLQKGAFSSSSTLLTNSIRKRKVTRLSLKKSQKQRQTVESLGKDEFKELINDLSSNEGFAAAVHAASTNPPPGVGLPSLTNLHLYKSLYRRHHIIRRSWVRPDVHPRHISFRGHQRFVVTCLQFDSEKILTGSDDTNINVYDTHTGALLAKLEGHEGGVWALQYHNNTLVSGSTDRTVRVWDIESAECTQVFHGHTSTVRCLQILLPTKLSTKDGKTIYMPKQPLIITGSRDSTLKIWRLPTKGDKPYKPSSTSDLDTQPPNPFLIRTLQGHGHSVRAIAAHGDTLVSGSYDNFVRVWKISTGECVHRLAGHTAKVYSVVLDHKRNRCISGSMDSCVKVWNLDNGALLYTLEGHTSLVGLLDLSHDYLVSAAADASLRIWDPETGQLRHTLSAHTGAITCFQHDGHKVISGSDGTLKMWNIKTGRFIRDLLTNLSGVWQVKFNERRCVAAVQRENLTFIEVLDFGAARDGISEDQRGRRIVVNSKGVEVDPTEILNDD